MFKGYCRLLSHLDVPHLQARGNMKRAKEKEGQERKRHRGCLPLLILKARKEYMEKRMHAIMRCRDESFVDRLQDPTDCSQLLKTLVVL